MAFKYFLKNGDILPIEQAVIPLSNIEYSYGFGVYESIRVSRGTIYFIYDHIERLLNSAKIIGLEHIYTEKCIEKYIKQLVKTVDVRTFNIKILLIGGQKEDKVNCEARGGGLGQNALLFIVPSNPLFVDKKMYRNGVSIITANYERAFPDVKSLNMMQSYIEYKKAKVASCYDALLFNDKGLVTEGTRTNFFAVKDDIIYTPKSKYVLQGVTRKMIMHVAIINNIEIIEKDILKDDLANFDGAFLTSTSSKIIPLRQIDSIEYPIPQIIKDLMSFFNDFLKNQCVRDH